MARAEGLGPWSVRSVFYTHPLSSHCSSLSCCLARSLLERLNWSLLSFLLSSYSVSTGVYFLSCCLLTRSLRLRLLLPGCKPETELLLFSIFVFLTSMCVDAGCTLLLCFCVQYTCNLRVLLKAYHRRPMLSALCLGTKNVHDDPLPCKSITHKLLIPSYMYVFICMHMYVHMCTGYNKLRSHSV